MNRRSFLALGTLCPVSAAARDLKPQAAWPTGSPPRRALVPTGLAGLDWALRGGLPGGGLTLLGSWHEINLAVVLGITEKRLRHSGQPVALISAHYSRPDALWLLASQRVGVDRHKAARGLWDSEGQRAQYERAHEAIRASPLMYRSIERLTPVGELEQAVRHAHAGSPLGFVMIDGVEHLQEIECAWDRKRAARRVGRRLRTLARSINAPILAACGLTWCRAAGGWTAPWSEGIRSQADLGPLVPLLRYCDCCLLGHGFPLEQARFLRLAIDVEFHPRASRGSNSCHTVDRLTGRITPGA